MSIKKKCFLSLLLVAFFSSDVFAGSSLYVKVTAKATTPTGATGAGKVYATIGTSTNSPSYASDSYTTPSASVNAGLTSQANTIAYLYAQVANANYIFEKWTTTGWSSSQPKTSAPIIAKGKESGSPTEYTFTASFKQAGAVIAVSNDETRGVVTNSNIGNQVGQSVTLTAIENVFKGVFKGWRDPSGNIVSDSKSYTFTVTESNKGTYTAEFDSRDLTNGMYIMLYSAASSEYLGLLGNDDDTDENQRFFRHSVLLANGGFAHSSPAFVIKMTGTPDDYFNLKALNLAAQGTSIKDNSSASSGDLDFYRVKDGTYIIRGKFYGQIGFMKPAPTYTSNGSTPFTMEEHYGKIYHPGAFNGATLTDSQYFWKIAVLTEDEHTHCFGAEPMSAVTFNGKYYTTMFTEFPYKCLDGVNAFIIDRINNDGTVHLKKVSDGIVPAKTPVILQCTSNDAKNNRLLPLTDNPSALSGNCLKGEIWIKDYKKDESDYRTTFNNATMRVLSNDECSFKNVNNTDVLAGTGEVGTLTYIQNNTCYLDLSSVSYSDRKEQYTFELPVKPLIEPESQPCISGETVPVTISCTTQGATIKYSTDGENWLDYEGIPVEISDNATIWAKAVDPDTGFESEAATATYSFEPKGVHVAELPDNADEITYKIVDPLTVAYVDKNNVIYAKDDNGAEEQLPAGKVDFMKTNYPEGKYGDHSNWVAIEVSSTPTVETYNMIDATGKVVEGSFPNRRIVGSVNYLNNNNFFSYNTYCVVNFMDESYHRGYFFATPAANEIAYIIWAQYDGNDTFIAPTSSGFDAGITADFSLYEGEVPSLVKGDLYGFLALVQRMPATNGIGPKATTTGAYKIYPLDELKDWSKDPVVTGIGNVDSGTVVGVKYYNIMGVASDVPFKGVNIVVTTYSNGTSTTSKVIR